MKKARETQDNELLNKARALWLQSNQIANIMDSLNNDFIKSHPDMAHSATLLRGNSKLMEDIDKYEEAFNAFSPSVQNSPAGILIKNYITNVRVSGIGAIAPDFSLKALDNRDITLSEFRGKYILLDFWGSWCGPCRESSPLLVELYNKLKANEANIEFIGIACSEQNDKNWIAAIENDKLAWIQLNDAHAKNTQSIRKQYAINGVPTCILISPDGKIIYKEYPGTIIPKIQEIFGN
jgi:thiol-disulfide isomerase/thioredoxin